MTLVGCSLEPNPTPYDDGIREARAAAQAQIDDIASRLHFSDKVIVLGTSQEDSCGAAHNWWFDSAPAGYRCWMKYTSFIVIPSAITREEVVAAVDAEMAALDVPYLSGGMVRAYVGVYPQLRSHMPVAAGGFEGALQYTATAEPFRPEVWRSPVGSGSVSSSGDASSVSVADVEATGASEVITITMGLEYWNTEGIQDFSDVPPAEPVNWIHASEGSAFAFELADWAPKEAADGCLSDSMVDQSSISRTDEPFPYLRFELIEAAQSIDSQRIRECIKTGLTSGTLLELTPYE